MSASSTTSPTHICIYGWIFNGIFIPSPHSKRLKEAVNKKLTTQ